MKSGWCTGPVGVKHHHKSCPHKFQKFIHIPAKRGSIATIQYIDEWMECECRCHKKATKPTTRRKK